MISELSDILPRQRLQLQLGPLKYQLLAYDEWGIKVIDEIDKYINPQPFNNAPDRIIHLVHNELANSSSLTTGQLPGHLLRILPEDPLALHWSLQQNQINCLWKSTHSRHVFWTATASAAIGSLLFHLPWGLIISDIASLKGGLTHGGLAVHKKSGFLFLAVPGGGKSTTLNSAPPDWLVLSDDAALLWPDESGAWFASPLPAWGNMLRPEEEWLYQDLPVHQHCQLKGILLLEKANSIILTKASPADVVSVAYRSLCEYPAAITAKAIQQEAFFRTAAELCRQLPSWDLALPRKANIWPLLAEEII